jgi:pSer/pThr/pTyr-binding forkhead associated (FHA) protein
LRLDASRPKVSLGRAEENDVRLYTASASREHAVIAGSEEGDWVLTLSAGKSVLIDGEMTTEPVVLEVGMNVVLGQDHLRCVTEGLGPREMAAQTAVDRSVDQVSRGIRGLNGQWGVAWWAIGVVAAVAAISLLIALLTP